MTQVEIHRTPGGKPAVELKKSRVLSAFAAGTLTVAAAIVTATAGASQAAVTAGGDTSQTVTQAKLAAQTQASAEYTTKNATAPTATKYTRRAHSFFGSRACVAGYCAPIGQSWLWYDSTDPAGLNLSRIQLNWADPERPCSTWIDFDAWNSAGTVRYWHIQGSNTGCKVNNGIYALNNGAQYIPSNAGAAEVCGTLYKAGSPHPKLVTRTCVDVG